MDVTCAYSALRTASTYGPRFGFVVFLQMLIVLQRPDIVDKENRVKPIPTQDISNSYDFIVIGGGSAGSVVATRLSECKESTVLLLEAGGNAAVIADVPALNKVLQGTEMDWSYKTEPSSTYCLGVSNQQCDWRTGKALGGSSSHNGLVYLRGNRRDYDQWRDLGNPGWGFDDVLPYFKKSEDMRIPYLQKSPYHGTGGYLTVENFRYVPKVAKHFLEVGREMGYDVVDHNGATQAGFAYTYGTLRNGLRCSLDKAFLRSASHSQRKNLAVSIHSMVDKILINDTTKTAYGVQFRREGRKYTVYARKEVILSAGAIQSPKILMLSGIGPEKHLKEFDIQVIHNSPGVGQNLQDHVAMSGLVYSVDIPPERPILNNTACKSSGTQPLSEAEQFLTENDGPLFQCPKDSAIAFVYSKYANRTLAHPDLELAFDGTADNAGAGFSGDRDHESRDDYLLDLYADTSEKVTYTATPAVMRPRSRGYIKLRDANPDHHPVIVANYFDDPYDLDLLVEGAKMIHNFTQTSTMKRLNARPSFKSIAGCANFTFPSDDYWRCHARYATNTGYHPTCSCKMGPANDAMAVVDPHLRVYGIKALRVADASIMPNLVSGNTNVPVTMIAEKAADFIKEDHHLGKNGKC